MGNTGWMGSHSKHLHDERLRGIAFSIHQKVFGFAGVQMKLTLRISVLFIGTVSICEG